MAFSPKLKGRCWMVTIHKTNMEKAGLTKEQYENPEFLAAYFVNLWESSGNERTAGITVCVSLDGCYHCHMACYGNTTTLKKVSDTLFQAHVEPQLGGKDQLKAYLLKEGEYAEKGEQVLYSKGLEVIEDNQGKRSDLDEIEEMLNNGLSPQQIFTASFKYRKYEKMIKSHYIQLVRQRTPLIKEMFNEYHFGATGSGKTYTYIRKCREFGEDSVYLCSDYANSGASGGGFDLYSENPAKIIFLDEFRGNLPYSTLLSMCDVYSRNQLHARYQNIYCVWESVIISTVYSPEELYRNMVKYDDQATDDIQQFLRRMNIIVYHWKDKDGHYRTYTMRARNYVKRDQICQRAKEFDFVTYEEYKEQHKNDDPTVDLNRIDGYEGGQILD